MVRRHLKLSNTQPTITITLMEDLSDVKVVPMVDSHFVKPLRLDFKQNGVYRTWDLVQVHERKVLVLVKQFRPAVYYNSIPAKDKVNIIDVNKYPASLGITLELCAGIVDKSKSLPEIAAEEIFEECGYKVKSVEKLEPIIQFRSGVGISGDLQTLFYCEVTDEMKVTSGGGNADEGELIEVVEMTIEEIGALLSQSSVTSPGGFLFAMQWFLHTKAPLYLEN